MDFIRVMADAAMEAYNKSAERGRAAVDRGRAARDSNNAEELLSAYKDYAMAAEEAAAAITELEEIQELAAREGINVHIFAVPFDEGE